MTHPFLPAFALFLTAASSAHAAPITQAALSGLDALSAAGATVLARDEALGVGYAHLTAEQRDSILRFTHEKGSCAGFEVIPGAGLTAAAGKAKGEELLRALATRAERDRPGVRAASARPALAGGIGVPKDPRLTIALAELKEDNVRAAVTWLSAFPSRNHRLADPNVHVRAMEERVRDLLKGYQGPTEIELVAHKSTNQKTLRVRLVGAERPEQIVVLGGHLDSVNHSGGGNAPGADDNASGSATLLETLRVVALQGRPARSVEFFWYAGEEAGLLGSAEVAAAYKKANRDVVAVLQLDMTLFPGAGELVIGNVNDFTSAWLRDYLVSVNSSYVGAQLIDDRCGYACSDHASWYRQGYSTLMPFESDTRRMNREIHTDRDRINGQSSFRHTMAFAKIALVFALDLGNSTRRE